MLGFAGAAGMRACPQCVASACASYAFSRQATCRSYRSARQYRFARRTASSLRCELEVTRSHAPLSNRAAAVAMNIDGEHARFSAPKRPIVFVLGGPGSGKGTQCEMLVEKYGWKQICAGELLRAEAKRDSELGRMIKEIIDGGNIVPGYVTIELLDKEIQKTAEGTPGILIDGFPRAFDQAVEYEKRIGEIDLVVYFSCSIETMRERLLGRGKTSGRVDDCSDVIESRFRTFLDTSMPVIQKYSAQGILNEVPSEGSPDEIFESLCVALRRNELLPS